MVVSAQRTVKFDTQVFSCLFNQKGDVLDVINVVYWVSFVSRFENSAFVIVIYVYEKEQGP